MKTDWFELREARLHLAPYTYPHFPIAVACARTPSGVLAAGKYGVGAALPRRRAAGRRREARRALADRRGRRRRSTARRCDREDWRLVVNMHCAEEDERAIREVARGERLETLTLLQRDAGPPADAQRGSAAARAARRHDAGRLARRRSRKGIERLLDYTEGGVRRRAVPRARMGEPRGHAAQLRAVRALGHAALPGLGRHRPGLARLVQREPQHGIFGPHIDALRKAFTDAGQEVPDHMRLKLHTGKSAD